MAFVELSEVFWALAVIAVLGYVFKDTFKHPQPATAYDPLAGAPNRIDWDSIKLAILVVTPAVLLHEMGHKLVAMSFGFEAHLAADPFWLALAVILKMLGSPFIFFVSAFVSWTGDSTPVQSLLIAFSGPAVNILLWAGCAAYLRWANPPRKIIPLLIFSRSINGFLAIFNLIPIPGFDGFHIFKSIIDLIMGNP